MRRAAVLGLGLMALTACAGLERGAAPAPDVATAPEPLAGLLRAPGVADVLRRAPERRIQIVLGLIEDDADGRPALRQLTYRADAEYFYPASTVKLLAAVAGLEHLEALRQETGLDLTVDTPLVYHPLFEGETLEERDATHVEGGTITLRHEIRKLFLVSDNEAFNKLYELMGQDRLAARLARVGLGDARVVHRLAEPRSAEQNLRSPRIDFRLPGGATHEIAERMASPLAPAPVMPGLMVGSAYLDGERKVDGAMDFAGKNRVALGDLQRALCKVVRPDVDCGGAGFELTAEHRELLLEAMRQYPRESRDPVYPVAEYPDHYGKFLLPGLARQLPAEHLRIYNKFGQAYGFSTENAWVVDRRTGRGFFLAATIYTNADGVLNDDKYEYAEVARPFFEALGAAAARLLQ